MLTMNLTKCMFTTIFLLLFNAQTSYGKLKILALLPYNGKSHFYFAEVLFEELARRGHSITVLSHYPKKTPFGNYHDISMAGKISDGIHKIDMDDISKKNSLLEMIGFFGIGLTRVCEEGLSHPNVQKLLKSNEKYDLIITEMFNADCFLGFVHKFKAPNVAIRTSALSVWVSDRSGNPDNPAYIPGTTTGFPSSMNFIQRLQNLLSYFTLKIVYRIYDKWCERVARKHFGKDMPSLNDIAKNTSLYLIDSHFIHQYAKPLMPNVKDIAGLHVREVKPLPKDLEDWISGAKEGLVYLNLGSMINPSSMSKEKKLAFFGAFSKLTGYRVLMKWNSDNMPGLPKNVKLTTWAPQNDILHHPKVKLFITHGGMLGSIESVHAGVPMIIIPFFGDQLTNAQLLQERGFGIVLQYPDITLDALDNTLRCILHEPKFAKRVKELSAAFRDRPVPPLDEAIYWIEYVARYHGTAAANVMRSSSLELNIVEYLLLDVIIVLGVTIFIILRVILTVLCYCARKSKTVEKKKKKNN